MKMNKMNNERSWSASQNFDWLWAVNEIDSRNVQWKRSIAAAATRGTARSIAPIVPKLPASPLATVPPATTAAFEIVEACSVTAVVAVVFDVVCPSASAKAAAHNAKSSAHEEYIVEVLSACEGESKRCEECAEITCGAENKWIKYCALSNWY